MKNSREVIDYAAHSLSKYHAPLEGFDQDMKFSDDPSFLGDFTTEGKIHELRNYVGMVLEELRYSCENVRRQMLKDRA